MQEVLDLIIIGAGPCGLACGIEAQKAGLDYQILEKGSIAESIRRYPIHMTFFSTAENIEIGGLPLSVAGPKANRSEALQYYRKVSEYYDLNIQLASTVEQIEKKGDLFYLQDQQGRKYQSRNVVLATGYFDCPRSLNIPGENLPQVKKYYDEPYAYVHREVVIVGGGNSAVEAALDLYRHGVKVHMILRKEDFKPTAKYWLIPDLRNRVRDGKIKATFSSSLQRIEEGKVYVQTEGKGEQVFPADFVFLLVGYTPDAELMRGAGIQVNEEDLRPHYDSDTFETNVPGLFIAGTAAAGIHTEKVFIENGRHDGAKIIHKILHAQEKTLKVH